MSDSIESHQKEVGRFPPTPEFSAKALVQSHAAYTSMYEQSLSDPEAFWRENTQELVFRKTWTKFQEWELPHAKFFSGATLNVSESCLDRHLKTSARTRAAIVFEGEPGDIRTLTYFELHREVVRLSAALTDMGVVPGDRVAIYMGMVPETAIAMLACARIGATHSVIFGGFSSDALSERINDCGAKVLLTQDGAWRRGNVVPLKKMADVALEKTNTIQHVVVLRRIGPDHAPVQ
jgi:acetyl-CoA synthetase